MKRKIIFGGVFLMFLTPFFIISTSFAANEDNGFTLDGTINGEEYKGYLYLTYNNLKDSVLVKGNTFHFEGKIPFTCIALLGTRTSYIDKDFYLEKTKIKMEITILKESNEGKISYHPKLNSISGTKTIFIQEDFEKFRNLHEKDSDWNVKLYEKLIEITSKYPQNSYSGILLDNISEEFKFSNQQLEKVYKMLDLNYQNQYAIINLNRKVFGIGNINKGDRIVDFVLQNQHGKYIETKRLRGSYLLIEFWASWCGPCRNGFPELNRVYNKFKDKEFKIGNKGFKILGVSIDDDKDKWLKAIQKDKLVWENVIDKGGFLSKTAIKYGVSAIPSNFLVDKSGNIIAKNITPLELEQILAGNLKK
jgi:thiol-disulfide isomerase/thioredoxin